MSHAFKDAIRRAVKRASRSLRGGLGALKWLLEDIRAGAQGIAFYCVSAYGARNFHCLAECREAGFFEFRDGAGRERWRSCATLGCEPHAYGASRGVRR